MAELESNIDEIEGWLTDLVASVDFTMPGKDKSLGEDCADIVAQGIIARTTAEQSKADMSPLKATEPKYTARKARKYSTDLILVRTGQMMSLASVRGEVTVTEQEVVMKYGTGETPSNGSTGYITDSDKRVTDRQKAGWLSDERPFYELDNTIAEEVIEAAGDAISDLFDNA